MIDGRCGCGKSVRMLSSRLHMFPETLSSMNGYEIARDSFWKLKPTRRNETHPHPPKEDYCTTVNFAPGKVFPLSNRFGAPGRRAGNTGHTAYERAAYARRVRTS